MDKTNLCADATKEHRNKITYGTKVQAYSKLIDLCFFRCIRTTPLLKADFELLNELQFTSLRGKFQELKL